MMSNAVATLGLLLLADAPPPKPPAPMEFKGFVAPVHRVTVGSRAAGQVIELPAREGDRVKKGDVLARLDAPEQALAVKRAEGRLAVAKARLAELQAGPRPEEVRVAQASLEEAQEAVKLADAELLRLKQAAAKAPGLVSAQETARAEGAARTARARLKKEEAALALLKAGAPTGRLQVARAEVTLRQVEVAQAKALLDAATVRAPLDGTVLKLNVRVGEFVSPQASGIATPGSICELGDMSSLEVDVAVHERNLARVFKGQRCEVRLDAFPDTAYRAVVERVSPTVDRGRNTVTVRVRLELPKKDQTLPVDASAVVRFLPR